MPDTIEAILRRNYDEFSKGNVEPLMNSVADDVKWQVSGGSPLAGEYVGKAAILDFFGRMMQLYGGTLRLQILDVLVGEQHGAVLTQEQARYEGRNLRFQSVHVWEVRNCEFSAFRVYYDDSYHKFWPVQRQAGMRDGIWARAELSRQ